MAAIAASAVLGDAGAIQVWEWVWVWVRVESGSGSDEFEQHKSGCKSIRSPVRRSHFTAVACPTGRVERQYERTAILVTLMAMMI